MRRTALLLTAVVAAAPLSCKKYDADDYVLSPTSLDTVIAISVDRRTLPADGFSRTMVRAQLGESSASQRTVKFTTTAGKLWGATSGTDIDVVADAEGRATILLESEKALRTAVVRAKAGEVIRETTVEFVAVNPTDIVTMTSSATSVPADGRSAARIVASVNAALPADRKRVAFVTTLGNFAESNAQTFNPAGTINDQAGADLRSAERGMARVTAQVDGVGAELLVEFATAPPQEITVTPGRVLIPANDTLVTITANLHRQIGTPTAGQIVTFTALNPAGDTVGQWSGIERSNVEGVAKAQYSAQGVAYRGPVRITASVGAVSGHVDVRIVNP